MESKHWYQSKTIWGLVLVVAGIAASHWHVAVPTDDQTVSAIIDFATKAAEAIGSLLVLWGRLKADTTIGKHTG